MEQPGPAIAHKRRGAGTAIILYWQADDAQIPFSCPACPARIREWQRNALRPLAHRSLTADPLGLSKACQGGIHGDLEQDGKSQFAHWATLTISRNQLAMRGARQERQGQGAGKGMPSPRCTLHTFLCENTNSDIGPNPAEVDAWHWVATSSVVHH
jgi:hypothetical protein